MSVEIIQERLASYQYQSLQEEENAIREIVQEIVLAGLSRAGFFKAAAFQGGTCLRILYGMERFSEDLDFLLLEPNEKFSLEDHLKDIQLELKIYGLDFEMTDRKKTEGAVKFRFLKEDSLVKVIDFKYLRPARDTRSIKVKIEMDTNPPQGSGFEVKYHDFPFAYEVNAQDMPSLFASKSHALLCRPRYVKGRDWYDFVWYVSRRVKINFAHLTAAIDQLGPWKGQGIQANKDWYLTQMGSRIRFLNIEEVKNDVRRFVKTKDLPSIELWSTDFFLDRLIKLEGIL